MNRRDLFKAAATAAVGGVLSGSKAFAEDRRPTTAPAVLPKFKLGMVTYNIAGEWDIPTLIRNCRATGCEAVELRTTHKHGVEPSLGATQRKDVKKQFADGGVRLWGLGSVCEFHSPDPAVVRKNIDLCRQFCELARDVGAAGVKVRPNGLPKEVPVEKTLEQIGKAFRECGKLAEDNGVEIWVEVHGFGSSHPPHMWTMMQHCDHPKVGLTWNSNPTDLKDGSVREYFELLRPKILSCHINELTSEYPWRELFTLLRESGYDRYTLMEIQPFKSALTEDDVQRFLKYYRKLWLELCGSC